MLNDALKQECKFLRYEETFVQHYLEVVLWRMSNNNEAITKKLIGLSKSTTSHRGKSECPRSA